MRPSGSAVARCTRAALDRGFDAIGSHAGRSPSIVPVSSGVTAMNLFVPYDDSDLSRFALREACLMMTSRDAIIVMAAVIVPTSLDIDVSAGEVWKQTCTAEVQLQAARSYAEQMDFNVDLRCVR